MHDINPYASPRTEPGELASGSQAPPASVLGALGRGTALYAKLFPAVAVITFAVWTPLELFISYVEYFVLDPDDVAAVFRLQLMADSFVGIIASGGVISLGIAAERGQYKTAWQGLMDGLHAWPRFFGARFLGGIFILLGLLLLVLPGIYIGVCLLLAETIVIAEGKGVMRSLSRSKDLTRGNFWPLLALAVVTMSATAAIGIGVFAPLAFFPEIDHWLLSAALGLVVDLFVPWMLLVFVAAYSAVVEQERWRHRQSGSPPAPHPLATM
jgi:hypothetical protein